MVKVHFIFPIIRLDFIKPAIETLYQFTNNEEFRVIVVDQSIDGLDTAWIDKYVHLYIRQKNKGFANAANKGIIHSLRDQVPYIAVVNDDVRFMYDGWFDDAIEEFATDPKIVAVCPESPRIPLWGYGRPHEEYIDLVEYKEQYTPEDIAFLKSGDYEGLVDRFPPEPMDIPDKLPDGRADWKGKIYIPVEQRKEQPNYGQMTFPLHKRGVIDAIAMWCPIFKREALIELGLFEEKYVWGGGEDYDLNTRAYTCAWPVDREVCDPDYHRRMVSTMKSWVWHWWGKSKDIKAELDPELFAHKQPWNDADYLWPPDMNQGRHMDPWGHPPDPGNPEAPRIPLRRIKEVYIEPL
jgi:GT2 family glycosyltransferase